MVTKTSCINHVLFSSKNIWAVTSTDNQFQNYLFRHERKRYNSLKWFSVTVKTQKDAENFTIKIEITMFQNENCFACVFKGADKTDHDKINN